MNYLKTFPTFNLIIVLLNSTETKNLMGDEMEKNKPGGKRKHILKIKHL